MALENEIRGNVNTRTASTMNGNEWVDMDGTDDGGVSFDSFKITAQELAIYATLNGVTFYTQDGTLPSQRVITTQGFPTIFIDGDVRLTGDTADRAFVAGTEIGNGIAEMGYNTTTLSGFLNLENSVNETFFSVNDNSVNSKYGYEIDGSLFLYNKNNSQSNTFTGHGLTPNSAGFSNTITGNNVGPLTTSMQQGSIFGANSFGNFITGNGMAAIGFATGGNVENGNFLTFLGAGAGAETLGDYSGSIGLGANAKISKNNQMVVGANGNTYEVSEVVWGRGINDDVIPVSSTGVLHKITSLTDGSATDESSDYHFTFRSSAGLGTGDGGDFIFQVAPSGTSGSAQNDFIDAMIIKSSGFIGVGYADSTVGELMAVNGSARFNGGIGALGEAPSGNSAIRIPNNTTAISFGASGGAAFFQSGGDTRINATQSGGGVRFDVAGGGHVLNIEMGGLPTFAATARLKGLSSTVTLTNRPTILAMEANYWDGAASQLTQFDIEHNTTDTIGSSQIDFTKSGDTKFTILGNGVVKYKAFTVATLPPVEPGGMIRVSDEVGGDTLAYSDGVNWLRNSDGAIVS